MTRFLKKFLEDVWLEGFFGLYDVKKIIITISLMSKVHVGRKSFKSENDLRASEAEALEPAEPV